LLERIQICLTEHNSLGIVIIDPRDGRVEKKFIGDGLERIHHKMRFGNMPISKKPTPNIVERLLYSDSKTQLGYSLRTYIAIPYFIFLNTIKSRGLLAF